MGSFMASDLISRYPDMAKEVTLVSVRKSYQKDEIERIKAYLRKDSKAFLYKFYHECFSNNEAKALSWFKGDIMKRYLSDMDLDLLLEDLDYLLKARIKLERAEGIRIIFIHGQEDRIAPIEEAMEIRGGLPRAEFVSLKGAGHMPFLAANFKEIFSGARSE
jgi:pimeloyl-ACP methyl ester carboxylesterase